MGNSGLMLQAPIRKDEESDLLSQLGMAVRQGNVIYYVIIADFNLPDIHWADGTAQSF